MTSVLYGMNTLRNSRVLRFVVYYMVLPVMSLFQAMF